MPTPHVTRREFISEAAVAGTALAFVPRLTAAPAAAEFRSNWHLMPDRPWAGPEFWTNPLQDWRVAGGRLELVKAAPARNVHVLTRELAAGAGTLTMQVRLGRPGTEPIAGGKGGAGFNVGVVGPLSEYRNSLIFGTGLNCGLRSRGELFIGNGPDAKSAPVALAARNAVELRLELETPAGGGATRLRLAAHDAADGALLAAVERADLPAALAGNLALVANFGAAPAGAGPAAAKAAANTDRWWFADWRIAGSKVAVHAERAFGPLFFNHYTLHARTLKMTVQLPPLAATDDRKVKLQVRRGGAWTTVAEAEQDPAARTALLRVANWDDTADVPYRVTGTLRTTDGKVTEHAITGTIRRDPGASHPLAVADLSCNAHFAFPNTAAAASVLKLNPDLVAFTGDQYYESTGGYGVDRSGGDFSLLDVLRKWLMHGWTWRELTKDRPSVSIPDDHDVYHGNLWGQGGSKAPGSEPPAEAKGGYKMTADFVNAVHRMQTSHHPDSPGKPGLQEITSYYGPLTYGRVSFAVLADRQYKTGPDGNVPPTTSGRADHVVDPKFDPKTADLPGLEMLGQAQTAFLRDWTKDWRGADMKAAISQTIFTAMATHHGRNDDYLVADYDTNAWPQTPRNAAVRELRRVFAFHLAGDQHLPAVVHYGVDAHRDGVVAFASPAVNNLYFRRFKPVGGGGPTGDFRDSFGHPLTVIACANPKEAIRPGVLDAEVDKSAGFGLVRFDTVARTITVECWPLLADPLQKGTQFPGWPVVVTQSANYARKAAAQLPELRISGMAKPVLEVVDEANGETVYGLRLPGTTWRPPVFAAGNYTVRLTEPETGKRHETKGVKAEAGSTAVLRITAG